MNLTETRCLHGTAPEECTFLPVTRDHLKVAGNRAAAITYAAVVYRTRLDGPGDTEPMDITVHSLQRAQGVLAQSDRTIRSCLAALIKDGVIDRCGAGKDNRYRIKINRVRIAERCGKATEPVRQSNRTGAAKLPNRILVGSVKLPNPNKEVRDIGKRQLRDHPPNPPSSTKHLGGWTPLHSQIKKLLLEYSDLYPDDRWNNQTVRNFAREIQGEEADRLLEQLGSTLHQQATGQERRCRGWGGLIERASSWREQPWCASRKPADRLQALVDRARARALERA